MSAVPADDLPPGVTPAMLEQFRAIGLRLDRHGQFWHQGAAVTHPRLAEALHRWLDVADDGRDIVRLDGKRFAYVDLDPGATHLHGLGARWDGDRCLVTWDDGAETELELASLRTGEDDALVATVRGLRGRLDSAAYQAVASHLQEIDGRIALVAGAVTTFLDEPAR